MLACELGRLGNVQVLLEHFIARKKRAEQDQKEKLMKKKAKVPKKGKKAQKKSLEDEDMGENSNDENEEAFSVNFIELKDRSSWTAL